MSSPIKYDQKALRAVEKSTGNNIKYIRRCLSNENIKSDAAHKIRKQYQNYTKQVDELLNL